MENKLTDEHIEKTINKEKKKNIKRLIIKIISIALSILALLLTFFSFFERIDEIARAAYYMTWIAYLIAFIQRARYFKGGVVKKFFKTFFWSFVVLFSVIINIMQAPELVNSTGAHHDYGDDDEGNIELPLQLAVGSFIFLLARTIVVGVLGIFS